MIIERIFTPGLAQVAYLVADEAARQVAVREEMGGGVQYAISGEALVMGAVLPDTHG